MNQSPCFVGLMKGIPVETGAVLTSRETGRHIAGAMITVLLHAALEGGINGDELGHASAGNPGAQGGANAMEDPIIRQNDGLG